MELSKNARMKLFQQTTGWSTDKMRANKKAVNDIVGDGQGGGPSDAITYSEQDLTEEQKAQARANIDAANDSEVVKCITQILTDAQQAQARENIGIESMTAQEVATAVATAWTNAMGT